MNKEFVPHQPSLDLKELGFDEPCMAQWNDSNGFDGFGGNYRNSYFTYPDQIAVPLYQQAFRWFREKYKLSGLVEIGIHEYSFIIFDEEKDSRKITSSINGTYEEAELECLKKLIEIVK